MSQPGGSPPGPARPGTATSLDVRLIRGRAGLALVGVTGAVLAVLATVLTLTIADDRNRLEDARTALGVAVVAYSLQEQISALRQERGLSVVFFNNDGVPRRLERARRESNARWQRLDQAWQRHGEVLPGRLHDELAEDFEQRQGVETLRRTSDRGELLPMELFNGYTDIIRSLNDTIWTVATTTGRSDLQRDLVGLALLSDHAEAAARGRGLVSMAALEGRQLAEQEVALVGHWESRATDALRRLRHVLPEQSQLVSEALASPEAERFEQLITQAGAPGQPLPDPEIVFDLASRHVDELDRLANALADRVIVAAVEDVSEEEQRLQLLLLGLGAALVLAVILAVIGVALFRSRRVAEEHLIEVQSELSTIANDLQRSLLDRPLPRLLEADLAVRYDPAAEHTRVGGDWFDLFTSSDGRLVITVGDVTGHGVDAVVTMNQLNQITRTLLFENSDPAGAVIRANRVLGHFWPEDLSVATLWIGVLHPATGRLIHTSAGHLPPILVKGSSYRLLENASAPPLGLTPPDHQPHTSIEQIEPGDRLVVYTDGLVETPERPIDDAIRCLAEAVLLHPGLPLPDLADRLIEQRPDPRRDDAALVIVEYHSVIHLEIWSVD